MNRINGFLDLNEVSPRFYSVNNKNHFFYLENEKYFFKDAKVTGYSNEDLSLWNEVIAYYVAKTLNIDSVFYDFATFNGNHGVISKDFWKDDHECYTGDYIMAKYYNDPLNKQYLKDMGFGDDAFILDYKTVCDSVNSLDIIWHALDYFFADNCNYDAEKIMGDIIRLYIFKLLILDNDNYSQNWGIDVSLSGISVCPIFDNEFSFSFDNYYTGMANSINDIGEDFETTVYKFLNMCSSKERMMFKDMYFEYRENILDLAIRRAERQLGISFPAQDYLQYLSNYDLEIEIIDGVLERINNESKVY